MARYLLALSVLLAACAAEAESPDASSPETTATELTTTAPSESAGQIDSDGQQIPSPPPIPTGPLSADAAAAVDTLWQSLADYPVAEDVAAIGATGDPRLGWLLSDIVRVFQNADIWRAAVSAFNELNGTELTPRFSDRPWMRMTDSMIAWDLPAPPGYADLKRQLFILIEPAWEQFFLDDTGVVDWRLISWGGVFIDDRELGDIRRCPRGCIPALDDPAVSDAAGGDWYPDDGIVFAVEINGEARAYPKNIMEVHEMVNDTLGGRRIGVPYCTLCGAAQAFFTDEVPPGEEPYVLRTSGLLSRSNKVMYELRSKSMFDTFRGVALTGPLAAAGIELEQTAVITTTWGNWKAEHPDTTIVAEDGGRGIGYPADPLQGRDDNGPIFPVGDVDPRLPVQAQVLGVTAPGGEAVAFPVETALAALQSGGDVELAGVVVQIDSGGLLAVDATGEQLPSHQAFWFAWSQFRPDTLLWQQ